VSRARDLIRVPGGPRSPGPAVVPDLKVRPGPALRAGRHVRARRRSCRARRVRSGRPRLRLWALATTTTSPVSRRAAVIRWPWLFADRGHQKSDHRERS